VVKKTGSKLLRKTPRLYYIEQRTTIYGVATTIYGVARRCLLPSFSFREPFPSGPELPPAISIFAFGFNQKGTYPGSIPRFPAKSRHHPDILAFRIHNPDSQRSIQNS
jgi:hypothetical protein